MNRWLRGLAVALLFSVSCNVVLAVCDGERQKYYNNLGHNPTFRNEEIARQAKFEKEKIEAGASATNVNETIRNFDATIQKFKTQKYVSGFADKDTEIGRAMYIARTYYEKCLILSGMQSKSGNDLSGSSGSLSVDSNENCYAIAARPGVSRAQLALEVFTCIARKNEADKPIEVPKQTYKPGTSVLDRYLTAPKEDCDAIPQSYNVSDRQQAVSQCRLRNANRDKYAANANAASAQPATNEQSAQQKAQQAQQQAQQSQARADQARQGKRKAHDPAAEAHQCIDVDVDAPIVGGFRNKCGYDVSYGYCVFNPKKGGWTDSPIFNCNAMIGKTTAGGQDIKANGYDVNHTRGGESVYFFACKQPASAMDLTFISGQGIQGRCGNLMGN